MEWISVKDRLPDTCDHVLICHFSNNHMSDWGIGHYQKSTKLWEGLDYTGDSTILVSVGGCSSRWILPEEITHWSLLTKPTKLNNLIKNL
jgi:hypothetical protein